jgi:hypothetical protein
MELRRIEVPHHKVLSRNKSRGGRDFLTHERRRTRTLLAWRNSLERAIRIMIFGTHCTFRGFISYKAQRRSKSVANQRP